MANPYDSNPYHGKRSGGSRYRHSPYNTAADTSVLGPGIKLEGTLSAAENVFLLGTLKGSVINTEWLRIGRQGQVDADVRAKNITVEGTVQGRLIGRQSVVVREAATVRGNIYSPSVKLHEGAKFNGNVDMDFVNTGASEPSASRRESAPRVRANAKLGSSL